MAWRICHGWRGFRGDTKGRNNLGFSPEEHLPRLEAEFLIQPVCIACCQDLEGYIHSRVRHSAFHQPHTQTLSPVIGVDEDVTNPGEGSLIADDAGKSNLLIPLEQR